MLQYQNQNGILFEILTVILSKKAEKRNEVRRFLNLFNLYFFEQFHKYVAREFLGEYCLNTCMHCIFWHKT